MSPTQRTLAWLREQGLTAQVVERWQPQARVRVDLFGCIDVIAVDASETIGVQATSAGGMSARRAKIAESDGAKAWLASPHRRLLLVGWRKYRKREDGKQWRPIVEEVVRDEVAVRERP